MKTRSVRWPWRLGAVVFAGCLWPVMALAEPGASSAAQAWRDANQAVAEFPRGHADVLKWEQRQSAGQVGPAGATAPGSDALVLGSAEEAVRLAWHLHRDLARPLARLGDEQVRLMASGQWWPLDPAQLRRIEGSDELLETAAAVRKAWVQALASQQLLAPLQRALAAAEAAAELGQRMVSTGNWSALQQSQVLLARSNARMALLRAQYAAAQAQSDVLMLVQGQGQHARLTVPDAPRLNAEEARALEPAVFEQKLTQAQSQWPWGERAGRTTKARLAYAAYQTSLALAQVQRDEVLPQHEFILNETVLHYNGMLKSTWDVLNEAQAQCQAQVSAINAQRDAALALIDLQWVMLGGGPERLITLGSGENNLPAGNGH